MNQVLLEFDSPDSGVNLQCSVKVRIVRTGQSGEKLRCPRAAVAPVCWEAFIDLQSVAVRQRNQQAFASHVVKVVVVLDAVEAVAVSYLVLMDENLVGTPERRRN